MPIELAVSRPDCVWVIDETPEARAQRRAVTYRTWVTLEDRSVLLNYIVDWKDVNGYGLHVTPPLPAATWLPDEVREQDNLGRTTKANQSERRYATSTRATGRPLNSAGRHADEPSRRYLARDGG